MDKNKTCAFAIFGYEYLALSKRSLRAAAELTYFDPLRCLHKVAACEAVVLPWTKVQNTEGVCWKDRKELKRSHRKPHPAAPCRFDLHSLKSRPFHFSYQKSQLTEEILCSPPLLEDNIRWESGILTSILYLIPRGFSLSEILSQLILHRHVFDVWSI